MDPQVTIAIPTYRRQRYIGEAIEAALAQTYRPFEVIVVDDASPEEDFAALRAWEGRVRIVRNERNLGMAANYNRCIELAAGDLLLITHSDDALDPTYLERVVEIFEAHPNVGIAFTNATNVDERGRAIGLWHSPERDHGRSFVKPGPEYALRLLSGTFPVVPPATTARTALYREIGGFDPAYRNAPEVSMWLRMLLRADVAYIADPLIRYRRHADQETSTSPKWRVREYSLLGRIDGLARVERDPRFAPRDVARARRAVARRALRIARKYARSAPDVAWRCAARAYALRPSVFLSVEGAAALLRLAATRLFGARDAEARAERGAGGGF